MLIIHCLLNMYLLDQYQSSSIKKSIINISESVLQESYVTKFFKSYKFSTIIIYAKYT